MHSFFKKGKGEAVHVNPRSILADIAMKDGAYAGKRVSRSELEAEDLREEFDDMESGEGDVEEGEDEIEEGEDSMSESSTESIPLVGL
jgi:hypothetical protein